MDPSACSIPTPATDPHESYATRRHEAHPDRLLPLVRDIYICIYSHQRAWGKKEKGPQVEWGSSQRNSHKQNQKLPTEGNISSTATLEKL